MDYQGYTTFKAETNEAVLTVTFDYASIDKPIEDALREEAYWLYQATSQTPAIKRFTVADEKGFENDIENQRNWNDAVIGIQEIK